VLGRDQVPVVTPGPRSLDRQSGFSELTIEWGPLTLRAQGLASREDLTVLITTIQVGSLCEKDHSLITTMQVGLLMWRKKGTISLVRDHQ
jgi:hypothetical protein